MDKKYQVFISSTYKDLIPEREKVRDVILSMYHFPIGMEMFNAADEEQWEIIKETIDSSDYYALIIGKRYGTVIESGEDSGISYTEKEFRYAQSIGVPILVFIKKDDAVTYDKMDHEQDSIQRLEAFIETAKNGREVDWFGSVDELGMKVSLSLHKQMDRKKRPGWIRGDRFDVDASLNELVVLSKRVRELEEENQKLRKTAVARTPSLSVSLQYAGTIDAPLEANADTESDEDIDGILPTKEILERQYIAREGYLGYSKPLTLDDVPDEVREIISQDDIDTYNSQLPDDATIQAYDEGMHFYNEVQKNGHRLNFVLANDGTAKATDINITLEFPKSFVVMKRSAAENLSVPKRPQMPKNPIDEAFTQQHIKSLGIFGEIERKLTMMTAPYGDWDFTTLNPSQINPLVFDHDLSANWSVDIKQQTVEIWSRDLLHTYTQIIDELCIIPTQSGKFKIIVSLMCEEYIKPEQSELEIEVVGDK